MKRARVSLTLFVAVLCLAVLHCSLAQLQAVNIVRAVENLAARFEAIKNEGLGVNTLEVSVFVFFQSRLKVYT